MVDGTACDLLLVGSQNNAVVAHVLGSEKDRFFTTLKSPDTSMSQKILSSIVIHRVPLSYRTSSEEAVRDLIALTMAGSVKELQVQSDDPFAALRPFPGLVFEDRRMDLEARYDATDERLNARNLDRVKKIEDKIELILNVLHGTTKTTTRTTSESCVQTSLDDNRFRKGWHKRPGIYIVDCDRRWAKHLEITGGVPLLSDPPPSRWSSAPPFSAWRPSWLPLNALKHCDLRAKEIKEQKQRVGANTFREVTEYAWILFGNQGTGSTSHFEPHKTAVWVKLLAGAKRWLILPPSKVQRKCGQQSDNDCSVNDSENKSRSMPRNLEKEMLGKSAMEVIQWAEEQKVPLIDFVQRPGDIVFIPAECMHAVLNLEDSLAYAENFIIPTETAVGTTTMTAESSSSESVPAEVATSSDNPCERERGSVRGLRSSLLEETKRKKREKRERDATRRCLWATAATRRFLQSLPAKDQGMFQTLKNMFVSGYG
eukprot:jgi/Bigna1/86259/estExt_fgenesh1_pg.C_90135